MSATLEAVLARSHDLGLLGPGAVDSHIRHAEAFDTLVDAGATVLDLGAGGGVPGLVLASRRDDLRVTLLDAQARRVAFLRWAVRELSLGPSVAVVAGRAERLAHAPERRESFDVVVARSFAGPAATAECAAGFLVTGGVLLVSEPASLPNRWPESGLRQLALRDDGGCSIGTTSIRRLVKVDATPAGIPRDDGMPQRRPLF
jgi:16S rRNA (guanine527-N7)-methyltransferase